MDQLGPVGTAMIGRLDIADEQRHLDVAAGPGEPGLTIARLAPAGHGVPTDPSAEMLGIAAPPAAARGITNSVARATAEFARVLKPGGRLCSSVWVTPEENPWTAIVMRAIAAEAALAPPDPDGPCMFRCAAPGYLSARYEAAGLREITEWDVGV